MASDVSGGMMSHLFPALGPALMISMGYIDLGKWVAAVEGGARFGFDLVFLVLLFNCTAILCQYISTCIGTATGKDLAEICSEEYSNTACILLGVQAEMSMIISEMTMILGLGHGLSLLFGMDLFAGILYATVGVVFLPSFLNVLDNRKAEALYICIAGFALLFYVLGVLISQPEVPLMMSGIFPKLSGESAYSLMALLGANVMAHNFYIHSSIVKQNRQATVAMGALFHDHFFAILSIFTGIFLVNYVLMNSAAAVFGSSDVVFSFQDVSMLMDQIFRSPIAPLAFFLVLFFAGQITVLTRNIGGQVISQCFFGVNFSWVYHASIKALSIIPALYCAKSAGAEGIYQLLIFCQVILAMLLPSSVIPLFRVASSRFVMHAFKISWYLEISALIAFLVMFASNIFFVIEMLFGNNSWMINLTGNAEGNVMIPYTVLLITACASIGLTLHLAVTPLKSASDRPETQIWNSLREDQPEIPEDAADNNLDITKYDENQDSSVDAAMEKTLESQSENSMLEFNPDLPDTANDSDHDSHQSAHSSSITMASMSPKHQPEESKSVLQVNFIDTDTADKSSVGCLSDAGTDERIGSKDPCLKEEGRESFIPAANEKEGDTVEPDESFKEFSVSSTAEVPGTFNNVKSKGSDVSNGSGSLTKLSGLGRAARRQLAAILDEFWGNLFDFHGKLTPEAATNRLDVLLGLDLRTVGSTKPEGVGTESAKSFFPESDKGSVFSTNARDYNSPKQMKNHSVDFPFGVQMASSSWSQNMQSLNSQNMQSSNNLIDPSERLYSSLHLPQYSDNKDYQPATIHGYQIASYLRELSATKSPYSGISANLPPTPSSASTIPTLRDQVLYNRAQNELGALGNSGLQTQALSRMSRLQSEAPYYEAPFGEASENAISSAYTKKYHSSPDISAIIALGRSAYLNEAKRGVPIGPRPSSGRMVSEQSQYLNSVSRPGVPLAFDQLSPPKLHRDVFCLNPETKSLWSRQPFEQLFGMAGRGQGINNGAALERKSIPSKETFPYAESGAKLLQSLRFCIMKLLKLEGSEWLFRQNGGSDEEIIDQIAASEKYLHRVDNDDTNQVFSGEHSQLSSDRKFSSSHRGEEAEGLYCQSVTNCGDGCVWRASLVVSFGVWCIRRILELSLVESRPELWGKYTYVLNRLQGIVEPAFLKPRQSLSRCYCLQTSKEDCSSSNTSSQNGISGTMDKSNSKSLTTASMVLEIIRDVEIAVSGRKGRTGTAAGDVAFPKGKENLASVLKRYKRRLLSKPPGFHESSSISRKIPSSSSSSVL